MAARRASESVANRAARLATQRRRDSLRGMAATAAAAGGVTLASTHVTADQLRDAEHDPIAAMLLVAESAGSNKWTPRLRALRRATTDEERLIAAQALGVALREEALSPEAAAATVRTFHRQNDGAVSLPACASCGMRAIPSDADDYQRLDLAQLECLRFTRVQEEALLRVPELYRPIHSAYLSVGTGVGDGGTGGTAGGGGDTPSLYFHLHPELVDTGEQAPHEGDEGDPTRVSAILCGRCVGPVAAGNLPPLSLASGHDYGVLRRVVRGDLSPLATRVAVANNRLYLQCIKMKAIGKGSGRVAATGMTAHAVVFAHNAPTAVAEARPQLSGGVRDMLHVVLLAPPPLHPLLRRCGLALPALRAPPAVVFNVLAALVAVHPGYAQLRLEDVDTPQERASLQRLAADIIDTAAAISDEEGLEMEAIATSDVAAIRAPAVAGASAGAAAAGGGSATAAAAMRGNRGGGDQSGGGS